MQSSNVVETNYSHRAYRHTDEIIEALEAYARRDQRQISKGEACIASYLAEYLRRLDNRQEKKYYDIYDMGSHRAVLLLRAAILFEESSEQWVRDFRSQYMAICNGANSMPAVFLGHPDVTSAITRNSFIKVMESAMPERGADYGVLNGVWAAVEVYIQRFIEKVYIGASMHERIAEATTRGIGGIFGNTKLLTYDVAGRTMFTFSREDKSISFVSESDDNLALGMGIQSCNTDPISAMSMIEDVIVNYNPLLFLEDEDVRLV